MLQHRIPIYRATHLDHGRSAAARGGVTRLRARWWRVRRGLWFVPTLLVALAALLAIALIEASALYDRWLQERIPLLFGVGAGGSRSLLSAIATSILTVAATVFSITLAVLSLAASQYSPRVLRSFMVPGAHSATYRYRLVPRRRLRSLHARLRAWSELGVARG